MTRILAPAAILLVLASFASARADDSALKVTLQNRYGDLKDAIGSRNGNAIAALLAPGFVSIDVSGASESAEQMIGEVKALPEDPNKVSTTTILSLDSGDNSVIVRQRYDMRTTKTVADGSKRNAELITNSTDTWVNLNGTWLLQKTETDEVDYYLDGERVVHKVKTK